MSSENNKIKKKHFDKLWGDAGYRLHGIYKTIGLESFLGILTSKDRNKLLDSLKVRND